MYNIHILHTYVFIAWTIKLKVKLVFNFTQTELDFIFIWSCIKPANSRATGRVPEHNCEHGRTLDAVGY